MWGCLAFYHVPDQKRTKLGPKAIKGIFIRYAKKSKVYRILDLVSNTIIESIELEFTENKFVNDSIPKLEYP